MNTFKNLSAIAISILAVLYAQLSFGQQNLDDLEYGAYLSSSKTLWKKVVSERDKQYQKSESEDDLYDLVAAQHGLLSVTMKDQDEELFDKYIDQTKDNLNALIENNFKVAESKALLSSVYGLEMGYSSWKGIYLGSKSSSLIEDAMSLNKTSSIVWQVRASSKLFTPAMFGGDEQEAVVAFEKAVDLYEKNDQTKNNWRYLDALAWLGQAYAKTDQKEKAKATFEKALEVEPDFNWVKHALLPKIAAK